MSRKPRRGGLSDMLKAVGRHLRDIRKTADLTQREVAKFLGVSVQAVRNWEAGKHEPSGEYLQRLAQLYKVSVNELLEIPSPLIPFGQASSRMVPIRGYLLAGEQHIREGSLGELPVPGFIAETRPNVYGLVINGESLKWNGIQDGDIVLVDPDLPLSHGGIYVLREEEQLFASRVEIEGGMARLKDSEGQTRELHPDSIGVVGRVIWHLSLRQL